MSTDTRPDIDQAAARLSHQFGSKREIRKLPEHLWEGETVEMLAIGTYGGGNGLLALTGRRLIFLLHGWVNQQLEDFPFDRVSSVQWSAGMAFGKLIVYASGNRSDIEHMDKADGKALADRLRALINTPAPAPVSGGQDGDGAADQLGRLAGLHAQGVLTDEEFAAAKQRILG